MAVPLLLSGLRFTTEAAELPQAARQVRAMITARAAAISFLLRVIFISVPFLYNGKP